MATQEEMFSIFNFSITSTHRTGCITKTMPKFMFLQMTEFQSQTCGGVLHHRDYKQKKGNFPHFKLQSSFLKNSIDLASIPYFSIKVVPFIYVNRGNRFFKKFMFLKGWHLFYQLMLISKGNSLVRGILGMTIGIFTKSVFILYKKNSLLCQCLLLSECRPPSQKSKPRSNGELTKNNNQK